jgi:hypothetical protein
MGITIRDIEKGPNEIIRIEISKYKGHKLLHIRVWFKPSAESGYKPTSRGIAININLYKELKQAIDEIEKVIDDIESGRIKLKEER